MKKTIRILTLIFIFFCIFCMKSNAFEVNFGNTPAQVSPGEDFIVEISTSEKTYLSNGHIKYDANLFTYEGLDNQPNMSANIYDENGNLAWMYTEISSAPVGTSTLKFKFKAKKVTQTSSGDFVITGTDKDGVKFITNDDCTYLENEIGGRLKQTVTIYVPDSLVVSPKNMELVVGETKVISVNKKGAKFESRDENIAIVDENGNVRGVNVGTTVIKVTDRDGMTADIIVTVKEQASLINRDNSTINKILPKTGGDILKIAIIAIIVIIAVIIFVKYKKYRKLFIVLFLAGTLLIPNFVEAFTNVDSSKIKSGIFKKLGDVENVVAVSPNNAIKYGQKLTKEDIAAEGAVFDENNLGVKSVKDKSDNLLSDGAPLATGYKVEAYTLGYEDEIASYNLIVYGDADGNATFCDNDDISVIRNDYVYNKKATGVYKIAANLYAYDDVLDVSDIQRMILKRFDKLKNFDDKEKNDNTLVNPFPDSDSPIVVKPNKIKLDLGDSKDIEVSGQEGNLTWESRNPEIATVDQNGKITAVKKGNTIITVKDSKGNTATVYVIVKNPATSVIVDPNTWITELDNKETKELKYTLTPNTIPVPDAKISWKSSDEKVAKVDENGVVTPVSVGKAEITVTAYVPAEDTADGVAKTLTDVCKVVINQAASEDDSYVDPTDVTLNLNEKYNEKTKDLTIYLSPEYSNSTVEWKIQDGRNEVKFTDSTDKTAKTVTIEGVNVTKSDLKVTVTVTNQNKELPGFTKEVTVRVIKSATSIEDIKGLDPSGVDDKDKGNKVTDGTKYPIIDGTLILPNDTTYYTEVKYDPADATSEVKWDSDKKDIATISSINKKIGKITTNKDNQGYTNIKAVTTDKNVESKPLKVYVAKIDLTGTNTVEAGLDINDISATVYPAELRNNTIKWEIADTSIATVDSKGVVHGVKEGKTTLTATLCAQDESKTAVYATMPITVNPKLDIKDEDGSSVTDGKEIIMSVDSVRNLSTNTKGDILKIEILNDNDKCLDNVTATDGKIKIDSSAKPGTATIKISYKTGVTEYINVKIIVGKITINSEKEKIFLDQTARINLESVLPTALRLKSETMTWSIDKNSSEAKDATIKSAGRESAILTPGKQIGKVVIIGTYGDTCITAKCEVTISRELKIETGDTLLVAKDNTEEIKTSWNNSELTFTSEDTTIADVGKNTGIVTGKKAGVTKVTVATPDGQTKVVTVTVGQISLSGQNVLEQEKSTDIIATINPQSISNCRIKWVSSKNSIATVDGNGTVKGVSPGTSTITATLIDNNGNETKIKSTIDITVNTKLELETDDEIVIAVNGTKEIKTSADDTAIEFKSANTSIATVDSKGVVTGKKVGSTTITIKYKSGVTTTLKVNVIVGTISLENQTISVGDVTVIQKEITPSTIGLYPIHWSSNNPSVATVEKSSGIVKGVGSGKATITAKILNKSGTEETGIQATCTVTVVGNLKITAEDLIIAKNEKNVKIPYTYDGNASDIAWSTSSNIITVNNDATINGGATTGTAIVTAKNKLNGKTETINVIVGEITLSGESSVEEGSTTQITKTIKPTAIENNKVKWKSNNTGVATVDDAGNVHAIKTGTATITATVLDSKGNATNIKATKDIIVRKELESTDEEIILKVGGTKTISTNVAGNTGLTFTSENKSIATVSGAGVVTGVAVGETKIIVTYANGVSKKIKVKVTVGSISITDTKVMVGGTAEVGRTILPSALATYPIQWSSSNTEVATIGKTSGIVTGKKVGTTTITAKILNKSGSETGIQATCTVTVIGDFSIDAEDIIIAKGQAKNITYTYDGNKSDITWKSSKTDIATVEDGGVVKGKAVGTTTIIATNNVSKKTETVNVIVGEITLSGESSVEEGSTILVGKTIKPTAIENNKVKWESNNTGVATVDDAGNVHAIKTGTATITATVLDSKGNVTNIKATKTITVNKSFEVNNDKIIIPVKGTETIKTNINGNNGLTFTSSNSEIASVSSTGVVTGVSTGTTKITVTYENGESKEILVTVIVGSLNLTNTNVMVGKTKEIPRSVQPSALNSYGIEWTSNNTGVATVGASTGIVEGIKEGTATITAKISGTSITAKCTVTVTDEINFENTKTVVAHNGIRSVPFSFKGDTSNLEVTSNNTSICTATIENNNVKISGRTYGETDITVKNKKTNKQATIHVTVFYFKVESVPTLTPGQIFALETTTYPTTLKDGTYSYSSSNSDVATISQSGVITAKKAGSSLIGVTLTVDGQSVKISFSITVQEGTTVITDNYGDIITNGQIDTIVGHAPIALNASSSASTASYTWSSDNEEVATVNNNGSVKIVGAGEATITVKNSVGATANVNINVIGMSFVPENQNIYYPGKTQIGEHPREKSLSVTLTSEPKISTNKVTYKWSTDDTTILNVPYSGHIKALKAGTANVICVGTLSGNYGGDIKIEKYIRVNDDAVANVVTTSSTTPYAALDTAIYNATTNSTVQLLCDIYSEEKFGKSSTISINNSNFKIDTNGFRISYSNGATALSVTGSKIDIINSKKGGAIDIKTGFLIAKKGAEITIENANISTSGDAAFDMQSTSVLKVKSGTISSTGAAKAAVLMSENAKTTITGGTISGTAHAIYNTGNGYIQAYIDSNNNESIKITSKNTNESTIYTKGNVKLGNNSDSKIYVSKEKTQVDEFEDSRPEFYIGGGKYGIQAITDDTITEPIKIYYYNGEVQGTKNAIVVNESNSDNKMESDGKLNLFLNDKSMNLDGDKYWGISDSNNFSYAIIKNYLENDEQILIKTPVDMYYKNATVKYGDVNQDGIITPGDGVAINQMIIGTKQSNQAAMKNADVNQDNILNHIDTMLIMNTMVGGEELPHDTSKENWVNSEIGAKAAKIEDVSKLSGNDCAYGTPVDISFIGPEKVLESSISLVALKEVVDRKAEYVNLVKGEDYDVENWMYTIKLSPTELRAKYGITFGDTEIFIVYKDKKIKIIGDLKEQSNTNVAGDFSGDGSLGYEDYYIYSKYCSGEYDLTKYDYTKKKLEEFKTYVNQQGYDSSNKKQCMYVLKKLILKKIL